MVPRANVLKEREPGRNYIAFYDLAFEVMWSHFNLILFVKEVPKTHPKDLGLLPPLHERMATFGRRELEQEIP